MNGFVKGMLAGAAAGMLVACLMLPAGRKNSKRKCIMHAVRNMGEFAESVSDIFR